MKNCILKYGLIILTFALFAGCRQELLEEPENKSMSIDMARAWFETHQPETLTLKSGDASSPKPVEVWPDWETAFASQNSTVEIVESRMIGNGSFGFATEESYNQWAATEDMGYLTSLSRIVVLKYKETGEMVSFIMTVVGDKEYLEKKRFKQKSNTYLKKDKDFNGLVIFQNLQGEFVNGWRFTKGEVSHTVNLNSGVSVQLKSLIVTACITYEIAIWNMICVDHYYVGMVDGEADWDNATYSYTSCTSPTLSYTLVTECSYIAPEVTGGAPPGGYDPPDPQTGDPVLLLSQDPCDQVGIIAEDADFASKMNYLKSKIDQGELHESAYMLRQTTDGLFEYEYVQGPDGVLGMNLPFSYTNPADGYIHSHYNSPEALSIFSATDIKAIYEAYRALGITSLGTFTAGVVTASGTTYLLKVDDVTAFMNFGSSHLKTENDFLILEAWFLSYHISSAYSAEDVEKGFLQLLQNFNTGLKLFKGNDQSFNQWNMRSLENNNVINTNCDE